jgi:ParB/RepB/Spo0J family partition protein
MKNNSFNEAGVKIENLPISSLRENPNNPRRTPSKVEEDKALGESLALMGLIEPLVIQRRKEDGVLFPISGNRRLKELKSQPGCTHVLSRVIECDDVEAAAISLITHLSQVGLGPAARARAIKQLDESGRFKTRANLGKVLGVSKTYISLHCEYASLPEEVLNLSEGGRKNRGFGEAALRQFCRLNKNPDHKEFLSKLSRTATEEELNAARIEERIDEYLSKEHAQPGRKRRGGRPRKPRPGIVEGLPELATGKISAEKLVLTLSPDKDGTFSSICLEVGKVLCRKSFSPDDFLPNPE